jgi:2'-5' RNA ligase
MPPIILTLQLDATTSRYFQALRERHFPPERNFINAHLTLFHHLPGSEEAAVVDAVKQAALRTPFSVTAAGVLTLGQGVAIRMQSDELLAVRAQLAQAFAQWLIPQDRASFRPHITIQNKTTPASAALLFNDMRQTFQVFDARAEGIEVWRYLGGPWQAITCIPFSEEPITPR